MFTSRAEYRMLLRQDNADQRLTPRSYGIGLASAERMKRVEEKTRKVDHIISFLKEESVSPEEVDHLLLAQDTAPLSQKTQMANILLRPQISLEGMREKISRVGEYFANAGELSTEEIEEAELQIKYESYIEKERDLAEKMSRLENISVPADFDFQQVQSLSSEAREKLTRIRPETIGQASRISGVSPSDIAVLIVFLGR
jgi:tRNA uridine 5-carboxymethylaminomethyl modification enzyme